LVLAEWVKACAKDIDSFDNIMDSPADMGGSEDFTWMLKKVQERKGKGIYMIIGANTAAGHHNEYFDFDEDVLMTAVKLYFAIVKRALAV
jgi:aminobenzoyl-glutamate utilization protein A